MIKLINNTPVEVEDVSEELITPMDLEVTLEERVEANSQAIEALMELTLGVNDDE